MAKTNGRQASEAPSSSSSDLYAARTPTPDNAQPGSTNGNAAPSKPGTTLHTPAVDDNDGDSSEMDVSDASSSTASADSDIEGPSHAGAKRKLSDTDAGTASTPIRDQDRSAKKLRIAEAMARPVATSSTPAGWPPAVWQQIFMHLSPAMLSRCMLLCKTLNNYLVNLKASTSPRKKGTTGVRVVDSESIWTHSRKNAYPHIPRPLLGLSERQMLQLVGGRACQSCGKPNVKPPATTVFNAGPGESGVRVIWSFRIRVCGTCFTNESLNDIQILTTKQEASSLIQGLPHAFRTSDGHFVPDHIRHTPGGMPNHLGIQKTFLQTDVDSIAAELEEVNSFGDGAADEWRKGLKQRGRDAMADSSRWERWEGTLPLGKVPADVLKEHDIVSFPGFATQQRQRRQTASQHAPVSGALPPPPFHGAHPLPQPVHVFTNTQPLSQQSSTLPSQPAFSAQRTLRNAQEVEAARAARRADIEKRCLELDPPLQPNALQHVKSFRDTMQITTPLTDIQWENMLKPKILEEREAAELKAFQWETQLALLRAAVPSSVPNEAFTRPAKEVYDRDYEIAQEPLRSKLGEYATDHINGHWLQGRSLDPDSAPLFAADVLLHVRKRYNADKEANLLGLESQSKGSTRYGDPFLSLDNMKWVFDNKVRSYTDPLERELFVCAGCAEERKTKWFAFEGLIQHYGAKHTSDFSKGNVVVHWQTAEWPDETPFHENPAVFIKGARKYPASKSNGRAKGTPRTGKDGHLHGSAPDPMLSENPLFSGAAAASGHNGNHPPAYPPQGQAYQSGPENPRADFHHAAKVAKLSADAREFWDQLDGVRDLEQALECVRMQTVIHHTVMRFVERFEHVPNLDLLTDALATNDLMRPIKGTHALACKQCAAGASNPKAHERSYFGRILDLKLHNISSLVTHFKLSHQPHGSLDWEQNLIELPEDAIVEELIRKPGMDDTKLRLVDAAFPKAFPRPLPHIGVIQDAPPDLGPDSGLANRIIGKFTKGQQHSKKKKKGQGLSQNRRGSANASVEPKEDEYDPRRPMFERLVEFDPSRFDTDLARKDEPSDKGTPADFHLAPETLAALNNIQAFSAGSGSEPDRTQRSPSVGRPGSHAANGQSAAPQAVPQVTPDIAAILASLTGQTQGANMSATPPSVSNHAPSQTPHHQYDFSAQQPPPNHTRPDSNRPGSHYMSHGSYRNSVEPTPARYAGQDLQAALSRNSQRYSSNSHVTYGEPAPAATYAAPAPAQAPRSPPRYRIVYEEEPAYPPRQPYDGQPAPIQYVPISEAPAQYRYEHRPAPPPPMYVDEYGRPLELIPINAAPAPVQYMPHPYEEQYARQGGYAAPPPPQQYSTAPSHHQQHAMYYQQPLPAHNGANYVYEKGDDDRGSVPRP